MTDLWMPDIPIAKIAPRLIDATARFTSPFTGAMRTVTRTGDRWGLRLDFADLVGLDRARFESIIARMRGAGNRLLVSPIVDFPQRGSFPSAEKFLNNNFLTGTTGWNTTAGGTIGVTDRRLRLTFSGAGVAQVYQNVSNFTPNLPHIARYFLVDGKGTPLALGALSSYIEGSFVNSAVSIEGLNVLMLVVDQASGAQYAIYATSGATPIPTGQIAGNYAEAVWTSLSQCMLIDGGGNLLKFSDTLASPWTTSAASVAANAVTAADATMTAATVTDTAVNVSHFVNQAVTVPSAAADFMMCGEFKAAAQSFVYLQMQESTGSTYALQFFNLSTGAIATGSVGTNWANIRAFIVPLGNGWYYCAIVARKTSAATTLTAYMGPSNSGSATVYTGAATVAIDSRRVTLWQSSVPIQQVQSGASAVAAATQTGSACNVKGLPASTAGLLLPGDWVDINRELKRLTAQLDSDAAGRGYLQFSPPIRTPAADNDPVIVNTPMGRFVMSSTENGWDTAPGHSSTASIDLIEAA